MIIVYSKNGVAILITQERWNHIVTRHPEMVDQKERVLNTISEPQLIQKGDFGELIAIRFYDKTPMTSKYLIAIYKEITDKDGFLITAYFTNKPSERRKLVWKQ